MLADWLTGLDPLAMYGAIVATLVGGIQVASWLRATRERLTLVGVDLERHDPRPLPPPSDDPKAPPQVVDRSGPKLDVWFSIANRSAFPVYIEEMTVRLGAREAVPSFGPWRLSQEPKVAPHDSIQARSTQPWEESLDTPITISVELRTGTRFETTVTRARQPHGPVRMRRVS